MPLSQSPGAMLQVLQARSVLAAVILLLMMDLLANPAAAQSAGFTAGKRLNLPAKPLDTCGQRAFHDFAVHNPGCMRTLWNRQEPDEECCDGLAEYFGANTSRLSANCFCVKSVWEWMTVNLSRTAVRWETSALICSRKGYIIPYYVANGKGGYCNGTAPSNSTLEKATLTRSSNSVASQRGMETWVHGFGNNTLVGTAFVFTMMSGVGVTILVVPILWDLIRAAKDSMPAGLFKTRTA